MIRTGADSGGFTEKVDVCIVGSGAGGGVAAAVFAEAGHRVLVLEEGAHVPAQAMTQREEQMYPLLYRDGGQQYTADGGIAVLQGRAVGGSTVINQADVTPVPEQVLRHWAERFGVDRFTPDQVQEAQRICREVIGANPILPAQINRNNALLLEGGAKLGIRGGVFDHNRVGCIGAGFCMVGCAYDAKQSVALTWLPQAMDTGRCTVQCDARAERFESTGDQVTAVTGHLLTRGSQQPGPPFRVEAKHFVLAAGAIHSPLLLLASGIGGRQVGRHLTLQPQAPVAAEFPERVLPFRGIPQSTYLDGFEEMTAAAGLGGFRLEAVSATPGMGAASTMLHGPDAGRFMKAYPNSAALLALVPDRPGGRVTRASNGRPHIQYAMAKSVQTTLREAIRTSARVWFAAGATTVLLPFAGVAPVKDPAKVDELVAQAPLRPASVGLISAHPQGTCRMGPDPKRTVVGLDLTCHDRTNLQVLDASVFPTSASSHTMLPVMAFSWLGARARAQTL